VEPVARPLIEDIKEDLIPLIEERREGALRGLLVDLHPADIAHVIVLLRDDDLQRYLFELIHDHHRAADVLAEVPGVIREHLTAGYSSEDLADVLEEMGSDEAADVLQDLPEDRAAKVLEDIEPAEQAALRPLLEYPEDSAGGIMASELLSVPQDATVGDAREQVRHYGEDVEPYFFVYVLGSGHRLRGSLSLKDMVLANSGIPVAEVMNREPISVPPEMDQEQVAELFRRYDLVAAPVVSDDGVLLGRITVDDVVDVIREEAAEDIARMAGTDEDEFHETSIRKIVFYRLPWILVSLTGGFLAGVLLDHFAGRLSIGLALVAFVPVIMAMGGNAGSQAAITMVRLLGTRHVHRREILGILMREARVGLFMGILTGGLLGVIAWLWRGAWFYGVVVGLSMGAAILMAVTMGTLTPVVFRRFRIDPAIATGPFVTVTNDAMGLLLYFGLAAFMLRVFGGVP